jgi:cell division protein FtsX
MERQMSEARITERPRGPDLSGLKIDERARRDPGRHRGLWVFAVGLGAVFLVCAAVNTMYSAVAERLREIATMRALGFSSGSVVMSFIVEALCIAGVGGVLGCAAVLPLNGLTTGTIN